MVGDRRQQFSVSDGRDNHAFTIVHHFKNQGAFYYYFREYKS